VKFGLWEGVPGPHPHAKFHDCGFKNVGLQPPKLRKNCNFWYEFAPEGKFWGSTEKVKYRYTTTNLPLCNDTIIVLKITLLHSISIIADFVIPMRDKQKNIQTKNNNTFSSTAGAQPTNSTILGVVIEEVRTIF